VLITKDTLAGHSWQCCSLSDAITNPLAQVAGPTISTAPFTPV